MADRILLIDDDTKLLGLLGEYLAGFGIRAETASDAETGLRILDGEGFDLVVLDVMMPGIDGLEACRRIRRQSDLPIIMLSARGEPTDRIVGLELGADDYMAKPFEPRELVTRIQTILRRTGNRAEQNAIRFADIEIRPAMRDAFRDGTAMGLTSMEYELLVLLAANKNKKFSRDELMNRLQGYDSGSYGRSIDTLVSRLRSKIGDGSPPRFIKSSRGFGYVFTGDAQ